MKYHRNFANHSLRLAVLACGLCGLAHATTERPNIVIFMADDMGFSDLGCYGGEIRTPHLDRLAAEGMRFTSFYNNAKCEPTRASLLTGKYFDQVGAGATVAYRAPTFGEVLRTAGYRTLMTGKWHAGQSPYERGFDRHFGLTDGCCNFFNPGEPRPGEPIPSHKNHPRRWAIDDQKFQPYSPSDPNFYTTDAFTNYALEYLEQYQDESQPFVLYIAYTAPHYPMHAWPEDIARYRHRYRDGWEPLREQRYARMSQLGLFDTMPQLSPIDERSPTWNSLSEAERDDWDLRMAVYAAMVDRMDQNIGRVLAKLQQLGKADNTIVMFLSDNGGESDSSDWSNERGTPAGPVESYRTVGQPWANASNTPFRKYKTTLHEGGIASPFIVRWPGQVTAGSVSHQVGHLIDVMATMLEVTGATYPASWDGTAIAPPEGVSLVPALQGNEVERPGPLCWRWGQAAAIRDGDWKLVRSRRGNQDSSWELYDLSEDRSELNDLAAQESERVTAMSAAWEAWHARVTASNGP